MATKRYCSRCHAEMREGSSSLRCARCLLALALGEPPVADEMPDSPLPETPRLDKLGDYESDPFKVTEQGKISANYSDVVGRKGAFLLQFNDTANIAALQQHSAFHSAGQADVPVSVRQATGKDLRRAYLYTPMPTWAEALVDATAKLNTPKEARSEAVLMVLSCCSQ